MLHLSGVNADRLDLKYIQETKSIDFSDATTKAIYKQKLIDTFGSKIDTTNIDNATFNYSNNGAAALRYNRQYTSSTYIKNFLPIFTLRNIRIPKELSVTFTAANAYNSWLYASFIIEVNADINARYSVWTISDGDAVSGSNSFWQYIYDPDDQDNRYVYKTSFSNHTGVVSERTFNFYKNYYTENINPDIVPDRCNILFVSPLNSNHTGDGSNRNMQPVYIHNFSITY